MKKCFVSSDVRVKPASFAGYTPESTIVGCLTTMIVLASDVANSYNELVSVLDPRLRVLAGLPIIDGSAWVLQLKQWIERTDFRTICTVCDECRTAFQHGRPCTIPGVWLPLVGGIGDKFSAEFGIELVENDAYKVEAHLTGLFLALFTFPRKAPVSHPDLMVKAVKDWIALESSPEHEYDAKMLEDLSLILTSWLSEYSPGVYPCHHGPGTTAERVTDECDKYNSMTLPRRTKEWCDRYGVKYDRMIGSSGPEYSRVAFVDKNYKQKRGISAEPIGLQWAQQGVKENLYQFIGKHPLLRRRIVLPDQTVNQRMALAGSRDGSFGTIDLSAASDSVSLKLVTSIFPARVLDDLLATRSAYSLLEGRIFRLKKFAPMGSAVCFPVESLVFAAICQKACDDAGGGLWFVYGDDIVISRRAQKLCIQYLVGCGFTPNISKSFLSGNYRESCGIEALYGYDITPIYYRVPGNLFAATITPECYLSAISLANHCFGRFKDTRKFIIRLLSHKRVTIKRKKTGRRNQRSTRPLAVGWTDDPLNGTCLLTDNLSERKTRWRASESVQVIEQYYDIVKSTAPKSNRCSNNNQPVLDWLAKADFVCQRGYCSYKDLYSLQRLRRPAFHVGWVAMIGEEHRALN